MKIFGLTSSLDNEYMKRHMSAGFHPGTGWIRKEILRCSGEQTPPSAPRALMVRQKDTLLYTFTNKSAQYVSEGEGDTKGKILLMPCQVNMTPFVQRPGLPTAQEQALKIPLAWSPLPLAPISLGTRLRDSTKGLCHQLWGAAVRQRPEKDNTLQSHQFSGTSHPQHTAVTWCYLHGVHTSAPRGCSLQYCCCIHCIPAQGPRTIWLHVIVCSNANIPLSFQHLFKPVPISFSA